MADTLKQTLYWNANPSSSVTDISGSGSCSQSRAITAAESHDGSDTTYARLQAGGDNASLEGEGTNRVDGALQTASVSGAISFIRVKARNKVSKASGAGTVSGYSQPSINGTASGAQDTAGAAFANFQQDFASDPADAQPWTNAKLNAQVFGVVEYVLTDDPGVFATVGRLDVSEFSVEVWGPDSVTLTPATVAMSAAVVAATVAAGLATLQPSTVDMQAAPVAVTVAAGAATMAVGTVAVEASAAVDAALAGGMMELSNTPSSPDTVTPLAATVDGAGLPVTLRSNTSPLYDQNLGTFASDADGFGVPGTASGTLTVDGHAVGSISVEGFGAISGVKFYAYARARKDADATFSNWRLCGNAMLAAPPVGNTTPPYADFGLVQTALAATDKNGDPWNWSTIFAKLALDFAAKVDYSFSGGHEFDESVQLDVAEIWCEVHGPVGSQDESDTITLRQAAGATLTLRQKSSSLV